MSKPAAKNLNDSLSQQPNPLSSQEDRLNMSLDTSYHTTNRSKSRELKPRRPRAISKGPSCETLLATIEKYEEQLKACMLSYQFPEAEELKHKIKKLRVELIVKKNKEILAKQAEEMEELVFKQNEEVQVFTKDWEKRIAAYKEEVQKYEKELKKKHEADLVKLEQDLRISLPVFARTNPQIINMRKVIDTLTHQKDFIQADELSLKCLMLEEEEYRKSEEQKEKKVIFILSQLATKQKNEFAGLKKRNSTGYFELVKQREMESQKFFNKLQTVKKQLEAVQQQETIKFEIAYRNFIPGERLQFQSKRRVGSITASVRKPAQNLNSSMIEELSKRHPSPLASARKRSVTPLKKDFHLKESYIIMNNVSTSTKGSTLAAMSLGRSVLNQSRDIYSLVPHTTTSRISS